MKKFEDSNNVKEFLRRISKKKFFDSKVFKATLKEQSMLQYQHLKSPKDNCEYGCILQQTCKSVHWLTASHFNRLLCEPIGRKSSGAQLCFHWLVRSCGGHVCYVF